MAAYAGKAVIVTGASQGIGKALSLELARQRPRLVLAARDAAALGGVARECETRGAEALAVPTDVADERQIVAISSLAGLCGVPHRSAYAATKHAQMGFFDSLRIELRDSGVSVTVIAPYFVQSEIRRRSPGPDGRTVEASPIREGGIMSAQECARGVVRAMEKRQRILVMTLKGQAGALLGARVPRARRPTGGRRGAQGPLTRKARQPDRVQARPSQVHTSVSGPLSPHPP